MMRGEAPIAPAVASKLLDALRTGGLPTRGGGGVPVSAAGEMALTRRESEILQLVASGLSNKEIANELTITEGTVKNHVHNALEKLHLTNRVQAAAYAVRQGLRAETPDQPARTCHGWPTRDRGAMCPEPPNRPDRASPPATSPPSDIQTDGQLGVQHDGWASTRGPPSIARTGLGLPVEREPGVAGRGPRPRAVQPSPHGRGPRPNARRASPARGGGGRRVGAQRRRCRPRARAGRDHRGGGRGARRRPTSSGGPTARLSSTWTSPPPPPGRLRREALSTRPDDFLASLRSAVARVIECGGGYDSDIGTQPSGRLGLGFGVRMDPQDRTPTSSRAPDLLQTPMPRRRALLFLGAGVLADGGRARARSSRPAAPWRPSR